MATNIYSLVVTYTSGGQFAQNILHYQFDDSSFGDTASAALSLCNAFDSANTTHLANMLSVHTTINSYKGRSLTTGGGFEGIKLLTGAVGLRTGNLSATSPSPVVVLIPTGNVKARGRVFLPGVSDDDLIDGEYTTSFRTAIGTHRVIFVNNLTLVGGGGPTATPVVYHRKPAPALGYIVEYARLSDTVGQLFRRQRPA